MLPVLDSDLHLEPLNTRLFVECSLKCHPGNYSLNILCLCPGVRVRVRVSPRIKKHWGYARLKSFNKITFVLVVFSYIGTSQRSKISPNFSTREHNEQTSVHGSYRTLAQKDVETIDVYSGRFPLTLALGNSIKAPIASMETPGALCVGWLFLVRFET